MTLEMDVFDEHVGGEELVFCGAARAENGAIVADSKDDFRAAGQAGAAAQGVDEARLSVLDHTTAI